MADDKGTDALAREAAEGGIPSMSTDNTPSGEVLSETDGSGLIVNVQNDMNVVDAVGEHVGKVRRVKMGDPDAVTTKGQELNTPGTWWDDLAEVFTGPAPEIGESIQNELARVGFVQIDAKGPFNADYVAASFQIASVTGDTVTLTVDRDSLIKI
jgi:hypothetical protein